MYRSTSVEDMSGQSSTDDFVQILNENISCVIND